MQAFGRVSSAQAGSYAALVDILLATMGIFVVVFAQLHLEDAPRLQPTPVDGIVQCVAGEDVVVHHHESGGTFRSTPVRIDAAETALTETWPRGARLLVTMSQECALSEHGQSLWGLETRIRRLKDMRASYVIEVVPVSEAAEGPGSFSDLEVRWRANFVADEVSQ
jgi:hypothetical protein